MPLKLKIATLRDETDRIRVFDLVSEDGGSLPGYTPGAHLKFDLGALGERSYSLIDWPEDGGGGYRIAVQREDDGDGGSRHMHSLSIGDSLTTEGPKNDFELGDHAGPVVLLAGGIGVTPLISMATTLKASGQPFRFVYAGRSSGVMGFLPRLDTDFAPALAIHTDDAHPLDIPAFVASLPLDAHLYLCGPLGLIEAVRAEAASAGFPDAQIHIELFTTPTEQEGDTAFEVELSSTGQVFTIPPGQTIIDVLEEGGVDLMFDCQRGDCGICQTDVIDGVPDHRDVVLSDAERESGKVMQICVSRAKSARLVLDL